MIEQPSRDSDAQASQEHSPLQFGEAASNSNENLHQSVSSERKRQRQPETNTNDDANDCIGCKCKKSGCLKRYCECFAAQQHCSGSCICQGCLNKPGNEDEINHMKQKIICRDPSAFTPKIVQNTIDIPSNNTEDSNLSSASHKIGCGCRKSECANKYCECFRSEIACSSRCRCDGCKNPHPVRKGDLLPLFPCDPGQMTGPVRCWKPPEEGVYKLNSDVVQNGDLSWGFGAVFRDSNGDVNAAATAKISFEPEVSVAQGLGLRKALILAKDLILLNLIVESDCVELIQAVHCEQNDGSLLSSIASECATLARDFASCSFVHITREANVVAHGLAKFACLNGEQIWMEDYPIQIEPQITADRNGLPLPT